jgi:hypothetical protein
MSGTEDNPGNNWIKLDKLRGQIINAAQCLAGCANNVSPQDFT